MNIWMDNILKVIKRNLKLQLKRKDMLDKYNRLPHNYQYKIGYDILIQNVILKELINLMDATIVDIFIELKMKISRIKYIETR